MRTALIRVLCGLTRAFPPAHLDTLAAWLLPDKATFPDQVVKWLGRYNLLTNWHNSHEWDIYRHGMFEPHIRAAIRQHTLSGGHVIDIGANIGLHTLVLSDEVGSEGEVLALEPNQAVRQRLEANLALNRFATNVEVCPSAASDQIGEAQFYIPQGREITGKASLERHEGRELITVSVPLVTVDHLVQQRRWQQVDLIKCDVEGHDLAALRGAQNVLATYYPVLLVEYEPSLWMQAECSYEDLFDFLDRLGYGVWRVLPYQWRGLHKPPMQRLSRDLPDSLRNQKLDILAKVP